MATKKITEKEKVTKGNGSSSDQQQRPLAKTREGVVLRNKMSKTVVVAVTSKKKHAAYGKYVTRSKHYMVHDEKQSCGEGDLVSIIETRPLSRHKRWRVLEILRKAV